MRDLKGFVEVPHQGHAAIAPSAAATVPHRHTCASTTSLLKYSDATINLAHMLVAQADAVEAAAAEAIAQE